MFIMLNIQNRARKGAMALNMGAIGHINLSSGCTLAKRCQIRPPVFNQMVSGDRGVCPSSEPHTGGKEQTR